MVGLSPIALIDAYPNNFNLKNREKESVEKCYLSKIKLDKIAKGALEV